MERLKRFLRDRLTRHPSLERWMRLYVRRRRARTGYPDWRGIQSNGLTLSDARTQSRGGQRVLIATSVGSHLPGTSLESVLGAALALRGAEPEVLLCDGVLSACLA